jgi:hypothetical protein
LVLGFTEELEGLILRLFEEVGDGEKLIVESDDFFFFSVFEFEGENVQYLIGRRSIYSLAQLLHDHSPKLLLGKLSFAFILWSLLPRRPKLKVPSVLLIVEVHSTQGSHRSL